MLELVKVASLTVIHSLVEAHASVNLALPKYPHQMVVAITAMLLAQLAKVPASQTALHVQALVNSSPIMLGLEHVTAS